MPGESRRLSSDCSVVKEIVWGEKRREIDRQRQEEGELEKDVAQLLRRPCRVTRVTTSLCSFSLCWKGREKREDGGEKWGNTEGNRW